MKWITVPGRSLLKWVKSITSAQFVLSMPLLFSAARTRPPSSNLVDESIIACLNQLDVSSGVCIRIWGPGFSCSALLKQVVGLFVSAATGAQSDRSDCRQQTAN
jgi:hypothetical protein